MPIRWALVAFSIVGEVRIRGSFTRPAAFAAPGGFAPYALPGSPALGKEIAAIFKQNFNVREFSKPRSLRWAALICRGFPNGLRCLNSRQRPIIKASLLGNVHYLDEKQLELSQKELPLSCGV